jgi:hypothetical protein
MTPLDQREGKRRAAGQVSNGAGTSKLRLGPAHRTRAPNATWTSRRRAHIGTYALVVLDTQNARSVPAERTRGASFCRLQVDTTARRRTPE